MKNFIQSLYAILISILVSAAIVAIEPSVNFMIALGATVTVSAALSFLPQSGEVHLFAGILKEIWISQLMENFYPNDAHLSRSQDMSEFVNNNTINLADAGIDPDVLVNNTTYPIDIVDRTDSPLALPLDYFDTKNTPVRNAEQKQLAYNKMESVIRGHRMKLREKCSAKATHAYGPASNGALTPVLATTGTGAGGFKNITLSDIAAAQEKLDLIDAPQEGRILVLHPTHRSQLLNEDKALFKQFANLRQGEILPLFGFEIYWSRLTPMYKKTDGSKIAFGGTDVNETISSLFYIASEVMRADGDADMFIRINDPEHRGDIVGFQKRFLGMPIRNKYIGAIYSASV